ncbi:LytTR family DNA-binding domain-containing protein [Pontibacter sp. HSC-36F09]|uniref:LytR/AlgR family response regulator transcription factor n=1 Tax=Pontibacter sp. HSC-36F09 TaxID=2910966 RepID=UPI0020A0AB87|nr:LytTR family DNA-binding domain-containing protein [Pontibacter sp. HSC-36F09]MCP2045920.1 DNA-binding LytR/AlgR family response regulator [Pontibacter sp. HSC-36F09]
MTKPLRCVIIDDEPIAQEIIAKYVARVPFLQLATVCDNAIEALVTIRDKQPDLIFLDINMPEMTGLEMLKLTQAHQLQVILTTAYPDYALDGFELAVADYLLKPISFERFLKAVHKVDELVQMQRAVNDPAEKVISKSGTKHHSFWVRQDKKLVQINTDELILVKGMKDYIQLYLPNQKILTHMTMAKIEEKLPAAQFLRVSRSFIVRKSAIKAINGNMIETELDEEILIGSTYREQIKRDISEWI